MRVFTDRCNSLGRQSIRDSFYGTVARFAFVEVTNDADADARLNPLNGQNFGGRNLGGGRKARPQARSGSGGGGGRGGDGGDAAAIGGGGRWAWRPWWRQAGAAEIEATVASLVSRLFELKSERLAWVRALQFSSRNISGTSASISA